jgi:hypothetical protein
MLLRPTSVGDRAFVGNAALVPSGTGTGHGSLVGVHTVPTPAGVPDDSSWLGSPAMHLPQRQDSGDHDERETFRPTRRRVRERLAVEFVRATLPASLLGVGLYLYLLTLSALARGRDLLPTALGAPLIAAAASVAVVAYVVAVKRHVVGTYRPRVAPLWDPFVRRTEFVTGLYEAAAVPTLLGLLVGTPFLPAALRRFGARIGRRTYLATTFRPVPAGTDGAVSVEGTLAGVAASVAIGALGAGLGLFPWSGVAVVAAAAFVGTTLESVLGATVERRGLLDNEAMNFLNTLVGALAAAALSPLAGSL